ncbi:hypothetical protein [Agrococcus carbonis]|uniref:Uncharacterized protein n=1 Tax=Agrococcus carbonis TaxID=684552 RepID=A0A1H1PUR2_9MICO|nr:hypothetical protein [Agrococcus carbonis]SDS14875.1 hypothetical protein SAMN04489719_1650 [Agrococcus carbonis]
MSKVDLDRAVGRALGRGGLIAVIVAAAIGLLWTFALAALHITHSINRTPSYEVLVASPVDVRPDIVADAEVQYATVFFVPQTPDATAMLLESIGVGSRYAIGVLAGLVVIWLAVQLLRRRSLGVGTAVSLGVLAIGMLAVSVAAPMLEAQATVVAIEAAGMPTEYTTPVFGESDETIVIAPAPHWQSIDFSLLALGAVTGLAALLLGRAARLQEDTRGLI